MILTLEDICSGMRSAMGPLETVQYELLRKIYNKRSTVVIGVPATMIKDGADVGKGERDEEKRE